jgi:C-terminal processing protease CtpA/Prc
MPNNRIDNVEHYKRRKHMKTKLIIIAVLTGLILTFTSYAQENISGVGLEVTIKDQKLTIIGIIINTSASKAGLSSGLIIQTVDGVPTKNKPLEECIKMIRGTAGSKVKLELVDPTNNKTNTVELIREIIPMP